MLKEVASFRDRRRVWRDLESHFARGATRDRRTLGSQGDSSPAVLYLREDLGIWMAPLSQIKGYLWCPFGTLPLRPSGNLSMVVQINPIVSELTKSTGGMLAEDMAGDQWICHTGRVGGGHTGVGKLAFLAWTEREPVPATKSSGSATEVLPIARVGDRSMLRDLAEFVREVEAFKSGQKSTALPLGKGPFGGANEELEGSTAVAARAGYRMTRTHGLVRNKFADALQDAGFKPWRDSERDIYIGDRERPDVEIEVKPSADSQSVYTAVGQLLMHSEINPAKVKILLIPDDLPADRAEAIRRLGIHIATFKLTKSEVTFQDLPRSMSRVPTTVSLNRSKH